MAEKRGTASKTKRGRAAAKQAAVSQPMGGTEPASYAPSELVMGAGGAQVDQPTVVPAPPDNDTGTGDGGVKIVYGGQAGENPMAEMPADAPAGAFGAGAGAYGAFSLETFATSSGLTYTHEDAAGFYDYVKQFSAPNFWYKDGNVQVWAYYETYDNWQDTYGVDAVNAVYHSGHGGRMADGRVWFPLGANWSNQGTNAWSNQMRLGNERANYIFWSTCSSLPVYAPLNPLSAWGSANLGFRMMFGYETTSVDNPNYGKFFFEEWNKGKSFSTAWLDASWRISHNQVPSAVACGASAAEAQNRLNNERLFYWSHVSTNYWQWRWYYASSLAPAGVTVRERKTALTGAPLTAQLRPVEVDAAVLRRTVDRYGLPLRVPGTVMAAPGGAFRVTEGDMRIAFGTDGSVEAQMAQPNYSNHNQIGIYQAATIAQDAIGLYGLGRESQLVFDRVLYSAEAGATNQGSGDVQGPFVTGTTIQYKQLINGMPVVTPGQGEVRVSVDNDGNVTNVYNSTRTVDRLTPAAGSPTPTPDGQVMASAPDNGDPEQLLGHIWAKQMSRWVLQGQMPVGYSTVPGSTEVGYAVHGDQAILVAQREIEVDFGGGIFKRYRIETPLV